MVRDVDFTYRSEDSGEMSTRLAFDRTASLFAMLYNAYASFSGCCAVIKEVFLESSAVKTMPLFGVFTIEQDVVPENKSVESGKYTAGVCTGSKFVDKWFYEQ